MRLTGVTNTGALAKSESQLTLHTKFAGFFAAAVTGSILALVPLAPAALTNSLLRQTNQGSLEDRADALQRLRQYGSTHELLKLCYNQRTWVARDWGREDSKRENAQQAYFAVTGMPFNTQPKPLRRGLLNRTPRFDGALGGEHVAGKNPHVQLTVIRISSLVHDIGQVFRVLRGESATPRHEWVDAVGVESTMATSDSTSQKLVDLWAADQVENALSSEDRQAAIEIAAAHHIVTPVSGAVVLETAAQFEAAGLTPVDQVNKMPHSTPEPATGLLAMMGLLGLLDWHRRLRTPNS